LTTVRLNPSVGEILVDLPTHHAQAITEVLVTTETASSTSPDEMTAVGPASTSPGSTTRGLYVVSLVSVTTSSTMATPTTATTSSRGHNAGGQRLCTASTHHDR
jgi:hypothetical protein